VRSGEFESILQEVYDDRSEDLSVSLEHPTALNCQDRERQAPTQGFQ
jgi:hypothetical protein